MQLNLSPLGSRTSKKAPKTCHVCRALPSPNRRWRPAAASCTSGTSPSCARWSRGSTRVRVGSATSGSKARSRTSAPCARRSPGFGKNSPPRHNVDDRHGTARLVRIDATRIADPSFNLPSLEAFAQERGLEDEREADQIAAYEAEYGRAMQRLQRRGKLIARQLAALRWLEDTIAQPPRAGDSVAAWLNPTLAGHLEAADIFTLAQLVERINGVGRRWYAGVKAMGEGKALRIIEWLQNVVGTHPESLALQLGRHVAVARSQLYAHELNAVVAPATDIRPLEKLIVPAELDGRPRSLPPPPVSVLAEGEQRSRGHPRLVAL